MKNLILSLFALLLFSCAEKELVQPVATETGVQDAKPAATVKTVKSKDVSLTIRFVTPTQLECILKNDSRKTQSFGYSIWIEKTGQLNQTFIEGCDDWSPPIQPRQSHQFTGTLAAPLADGEVLRVQVLDESYQEALNTVVQ